MEGNTPTPNRLYNIGLQTAKEIDQINHSNGKQTNFAAEWKEKYGPAFDKEGKS